MLWSEIDYIEHFKALVSKYGAQRVKKDGKKFKFKQLNKYRC